MSHRTDTRRPAFTLIELLVVISIIAIIAGMAVLIIPNLLRTEYAARAASNLQSSLFIAKQQALRDRVPYGVRLIQDPDTYVRSYQFIHQPDDFTGGQIQVEAMDPTGTSVKPLTTVLMNKDPTGGLGNSTLWPVQLGDFFQVQNEQPVRITNITQVNATTWRVYLNSAASQSPVATTDYRIIRRARPVAGEDVVTFPDSVVVDLGRSIITPDSTPPATYDILFAPAGAVVGQGAITGKIILWVRDLRMDPTITDDQSLIVVYTRSGLTGSFPVDVSNGGATPYSFVFQSARGSQ